MSKIVGVSTMTGGAIYVGDVIYDDTVSEILALESDDVIKITFSTTKNITYIPYHNIASWVMAEE